MKSQNWSWLALAAAVLGTPALASATLLRSMELPELTERATTVVQAKVVGVEPRWEDGIIVTDARVQVESCLKGDCQAVLTVTTPGGELGEYGVRVEGAPTYQVEDRVVLFLERSHGPAGEHLRTIGMKQGVFRVLEDPSGITVAQRELEGLTLLGADHPQVSSRPVPLTELVERIQRAAAGAPPRELRPRGPSQPGGRR